MKGKNVNGNIGGLRKKIDAVDSKILKLLNERAHYAIKIGASKKKEGRGLYIPDREKEIIRHLVSANKGPLPDENLVDIFREVLNSNRALQGRLKISFFRLEASFTHQAALKNFGRGSEYIGARAISDVFSAVEKGLADYGVVPVENTSEGIVNHTFDMFFESGLSICAEINMSVDQCLLSKAAAGSAVARVYSHYQAIAQCRNYIEDNLAGAKIVEVASTSEAARLAAKDKKSAAIASSLAADIYGLKILARKIQDTPENYTRFLSIGKCGPGRSGYDKTSVMFSIKDRIGALHDILVAFKKRKINLTKIESRSTKKKAWEYVFFIDFDGHIEDKKVKEALEDMEEFCVFLKVLGSYPKAE